MALLEHARQFGRASGAVAFPNQEFWRCPPLGAGDVLIDKIGEPVGVFDDAMELCWTLARRRTAISGRDRVDEYQVGGIEKRIVVVDRGVGSGYTVAVGREHNSLRAHAHVGEK